MSYQNNRLNLTDLSMIEVGGLGPDGKYLDRREKVNYAAAAIDPAYAEASTGLPANPAAAEAWITFLASPAAQDILEGVGFIKATEGELASRVAMDTPSPTPAATPSPTTAATPPSTPSATPSPTTAATPSPTAAATPSPTAAPVPATSGGLITARVSWAALGAVASIIALLL